MQISRPSAIASDPKPSNNTICADKAKRRAYRKFVNDVMAIGIVPFNPLALRFTDLRTMHDTRRYHTNANPEKRCVSDSVMKPAWTARNHQSALRWRGALALAEGTGTYVT